MDQHRRRRFVLVALAIWALTIPFLFFLVPPQPRVTIRAAAPASVIGTTSDSRTMYTACLDDNQDRPNRQPTGTVQAWNLSTGRQRAQFHLDKTEPAPLGSMDKEDANGKKETTLRLSNFLLAAAGQALAYNYRGFLQAGSLRLRSLSLNREVLRLEGCWIDHSSFSPDGKWFAVRHGHVNARSRIVRVFESSTGEELTLEDPKHPFELLGAYAFSPDGRLLAVTEKTDKRWQTHVWELAPLRLLRNLEGYNFYLTFSPDGKLLASVESQSTLRLTVLDTGKTRALLKDHEWFSAVAFAPDSHTFTAFNDFVGNGRELNRATTWDAATGRLLRIFLPKGGVDPNDGTYRQMLTDQDVTRTPRIAAVCDDSAWRIVDAIEGVQIASVPKDSWPVRVSPDSRILVTHEQGDLLDVAPREGWTHWLREHVPGFKKVWPDRQRLQLWDLATGHLLASFDSNAAYYRFTPDSKTLITANNSDRIEVWDLPPGMPIKRIVAWSLPLPMLVLLVGEMRLRRHRKKQIQKVGVA